MQVALYARASADETGRESIDQILADLAAHAARRGWEVVLRYVDQLPGLQGPRQGLRSLVEAVRANAIQGVLVRNLGQLACSLRHATNLGQLLASQNIALVVLEDGIDTTDLGNAIRWRDWLETSARLDRQLRAEAAKLAHLRAPGTRWGRPPAAINPAELLSLWKGTEGRRPLSQRELAAKLGVSQTTIRKHLDLLREAGRLLDEARAGRLATQKRRGSRPSTTINDTDLAAAWKHQLETARLGGTEPSLTAVARTLQISRRRVRARLQELGLLTGRLPVHLEP